MIDGALEQIGQSALLGSEISLIDLYVRAPSWSQLVSTYWKGYKLRGDKYPHI
jgi:hypothetical protein